MCESRPVSSRKLQAGTSLGDDGSAKDTRLCFKGDSALADTDDEAGKGALNEKVDAVGGLQVSSACFSMVELWSLWIRLENVTVSPKRLS